MKKKILELLASIEDLRVVKVTPDVYWHIYNGGPNTDVISWIWVSHSFSCSIQSARNLQKEIEKLIFPHEKWFSGIRYQKPKLEKDFAYMGVISVCANVGVEKSTSTLHFTDPEIENLESPEQFNTIKNGMLKRHTERIIIREVVIVICPDPAVCETKVLHCSRDFRDKIKIPRLRGRSPVPNAAKKTLSK